MHFYGTIGYMYVHVRGLDMVLFCIRCRLFVVWEKKGFVVGAARADTS
jgi:hypothetical protein